MKTFLNKCLIALVAISMYSCNDEPNVEEQENTVTFKISCNDENANVYFVGAGVGLYFKKDWEKTIRTKSYVAAIDASCKENPKALLIGEIWVNGKLKRRMEASGYLKFMVALKGHPIF